MKTKNLLKKAFLLLALMGGATSAWATEVTVTLSGVSSKDAKASTSVPSGIAASATITTGACGSSCDPSDYHVTSGDNKTIGSYYKVHPYDGTPTKFNWSSVNSITFYGTFTVPTGYTYKITKITHLMRAEGTNDMDATIIVKNATSVAQYTSPSIDVTNHSTGNDVGDATDINIAAGDQVTLTSGTYTLNINATLASGSGKYFGFTQVILTGDLEAAAVDTNSPEITTDLDDENAYTAYLGVEKTLSVEANHVTGYQWYTCTNAAGDGASAIDGATNYFYTFTPSVAGTYYYKCVATNENATSTKTATSKVATVNVEAQTPVFSLTKSNILVGGTSQIKVGSNAGLDGLTMTGLSYDDAVISIDATGAITALAKGTSTITFTTTAGGNYAAGSANLSITITGKVVASSTPNSWTDATSRTWSVTKIAFGGQGEEGDNGLYFKTGTSNSIDYSSGDFFSLKPGNIMYLEVPSSTSTGMVKVVSTQTNDRYLVVTNAEGDQHLKMSTSGTTVRFDANSIEEIDGKYYVKLSHGDGECKIAVSNFATVTLDATKTITAAGWATYCSPYALDFSSSIANLTKAYIVTGATGSTLNLEEITGTIPANTGILLEGEGEVVIPVVASSSTDVSGNKLVGVTTETPGVAAGIYVLMGTPKVGFYETTNAFTVGANTAYLPANFASLARSAFFIGGNITGIDQIDNGQLTIDNSQDGKFIENGKLVIVKNGVKYNAAGAQVK